MTSQKTSLSHRLSNGLWPELAERLAAALPKYGEPSPERQIFVNRTLRMESIQFVGFDLDWTLADYRRLPLEKLTFKLAVDRLIEENHYPETIRNCSFRPDFPRRGLLIDKESGTVLRMSRHRFVNLAYQGRQRLDRHQLKQLYRYEPVQPASDRFYHVDSLFELPEANLYAELIELTKDPHETRLPTPRKIFDDLRQAIDWVHAHGSLKQRVVADLPRYLHRDPELGLALARLALGGRRLFLLTNSDWAYAEAISSYLLDDLLPGVDSWQEFFDLVVVEAGKPEFFSRRQPFRQLANGGGIVAEVDTPEWLGTYQGGCLEGLMGLIGGPGESVLYVGDHIYGDIVSSKLESTWRTTLIVRELEEEIRQRADLAARLDEGIALRHRLAQLGHKMDHLRDLLAVTESSLRPSKAGIDSPEQIKDRLQSVTSEHRRLLGREARWSGKLDTSFNPYWGPFFKQGTSKTRFASQLETYACLYTSRVSNFAYYGSNRYFRVPWDPMMHELDLGPEAEI
ncbi:MAG: HAD-IG family 5'-nucleotidase [Thermoanaerobaculia bacterium]